jgi:hypothetical protein
MSHSVTPRTPEQELIWVHHKRQQFLDQLELKVMTDDKTPVSLLSLYRNTLRDHEAACYKMMDTSVRDTRPAASPAAVTPMVPRGKSMVTSCLAWFAAMIALLFSSAAQAQSVSSETSTNRAVCGSAEASPSHLTFPVICLKNKTTTPSGTAIRAQRTPPASD